MSWRDLIENPYLIVTGDGQEYEVLWRNPIMLQGFNVSTFEFPNVAGTLVDQRQQIGRQFKLEIYFQGDDHLEVSEDFRKSTADRRPWRVFHPFYGEVLAKPVTTLVFDNSGLNTTRITGTIMETLDIILPRAIASTREQIETQKAAVQESALVDYGTKVDELTAQEVVNIDGQLDVIEANTLDIIEVEQQAFDLRNTIIDAKRFVDTAIQTPIDLIAKVQTAIDFPFQVISSVRGRLNVLQENFERLTTSVVALLGGTSSNIDFDNITPDLLGQISLNNRALYELAGATTVSSLVSATVTNVDPETSDIEERQFQSLEDINTATQQIVNQWNNYVESLDAMETDLATEPDSFVPDFETIRQLQDLVFFGIANLQEFAFSSTIENEVILAADTNLIELTHRFYGLDEEDENIERLKSQNQIGLKEILNIPKGRRIRYYIEQ